jgi:hypothetical protein
MIIHRMFTAALLATLFAGCRPQPPEGPPPVPEPSPPPIASEGSAEPPNAELGGSSDTPPDAR